MKHSKIKNPSILFEILVKKITSDTLSGGDSPALNILKKYFVSTELGKEYRLYETLLKYKGLDESRANSILSTIIDSSQKLNRNQLRREKYNLVKELKEHYNIDELLKTKINNYKFYASIYNLLEIYNNPQYTDPKHIIDNKATLLEYITKPIVEEGENKKNIFEEFKEYPKDLRILTYKILLERFNSKHSSNLNPKQKRILKEFINSVDSSPHLREFYNSEMLEVGRELKKQIKKITSPAVKIKLEEISKFVKELDKKEKINSEHLVDLLQFHSLLEELSKVNK